MMTQRYNQETRELVLQLNEQGQSVPSLAREYGISEATIYNWKKEYTPDEEGAKKLPGLIVQDYIEPISSLTSFT